ncbi:MAG: cyclic nucleotide-binding domain-containing protein [Deltaproteobacteria bacterium]|nr:MAG: cyclic nucleotide-binding domain-containing protein [Deltaproteobacteria bacterium]
MKDPYYPTYESDMKTSPSTVAEADNLVRTEPRPELPPQRYSEGTLIARGGMSQIYKVYDHHLLRHIAMKTIDERLNSENQHIRRFVEESQITGQLEHPNIIPVHNMGCNEEGFYYFTMKMVDGQTLEQYLQSDAHDLYSDNSLYQTLQIFLKVCDAVSFAHSRGVIHRDLKPANIMVGDHGQVYVMDWGIAYLMPDTSSQDVDDMYSEKTSIYLDRGGTDGEQSGDILGTWNYMAPEQALGQTNLLGFHTDVFALGAVLYEILTGHPPYQSENAYQVLQMAQQGMFVPPQDAVPHMTLPHGLCQIAQHAMHPNPLLRYPNVEKLKHDIELFLRSGGQLPLRNYPPGELIIQEGGEGNAAFVITRGRCQVFRMVGGRQINLREMGEGEVFGETSIFLKQLRTASVKALDHVTVAILDRQTLEQKMFQDSWLGRFIEALAQRFIDTDRKWTRQRQTLERTQLQAQLLAYLCHHSETNPPSARWSPLCEALCQQMSCSPDDLQQTIESLNFFIIDLHNDRLSLSANTLHNYLNTHRLPL